MQDACTQTGSATKILNEDASSNSRYESDSRKSLSSDERTSRLSSTTASESKEDGSGYFSVSKLSSSGHSARSSATSIARSIGTSTTDNWMEMHRPESEVSTRNHFTGDAAENNFTLPPVNWLGYMTRGFEFSYFQYCSK